MIQAQTETIIKTQLKPRLNMLFITSTKRKEAAILFGDEMYEEFSTEND